MKDLGEAKQFLGINIARSRATREIHMSQGKLLKECLAVAGMSECSPCLSPYDMQVKLVKEGTLLDPTDKELYQKLVGMLFYASNNTRPDLCTSVSIVSSFVTNPTEEHMLGVKRILRYVKGTLHYGILLGGNADVDILVGYSDADWAGCLDTRRSRTGYTFHIGSGCITWQSKKQPTVALSTAEAEYLSLSSATKEMLWLRQLLAELGFPQQATIMNQDNQSCIQLANTNSNNQRTKHIDIRYHSCREAVKSGKMTVKWCPTKEMYADIMTKPLATPRFLQLRDDLNVVSLDFLHGRSKEAVGIASPCRMIQNIQAMCAVAVTTCFSLLGLPRVMLAV
jgi:hypothetical protein